MNIQITSDVKDINREFALLNARLNRAQKKFVNDVSEYSFIALKNRFPKDTGETAKRIRIEDQEKTPLGYERKVHIPPNGKEDSRVPQWLHHGTGVWGPIGRPYFNIGEGPMVFIGKYGLIRTYEVRGQKQNPYWRDTVKSVEAFATIKAYTLFNNIL